MPQLKPFSHAVTACTKLFVAEEVAEKVVGGVPLPFYVFVPLRKLWGEAASVMAVIKEVAGDKSYKDSLGVSSTKAIESKIKEVTPRINPI